jgi:Sel1 repeat
MDSRGFFSMAMVIASCSCAIFAQAQSGPSTVRTKEAGGANFSALEQQARGGGAHDEYLLGVAYMIGSGVSQDYKLAAEWYKAAAAQGEVNAAFALACLYEQGRGVSRDYRLAVTYYRAAVEQGHPRAENNLGAMYESGRGVSKDLTEAARLYRASAEHGDPVAQCNLASLYFNGQGVRRDYLRHRIERKFNSQWSGGLREIAGYWVSRCGTGLGPESCDRRPLRLSPKECSLLLWIVDVGDKSVSPGDGYDR